MENCENYNHYIMETCENYNHYKFSHASMM
jgi:hypothetical protein